MGTTWSSFKAAVRTHKASYKRSLSFSSSFFLGRNQSEAGTGRALIMSSIHDVAILAGEPDCLDHADTHAQIFSIQLSRPSSKDNVADFVDCLDHASSHDPREKARAPIAKQTEPCSLRSSASVEHSLDSLCGRRRDDEPFLRGDAIASRIEQKFQHLEIVQKLAALELNENPDAAEQYCGSKIKTRRRFGPLGLPPAPTPESQRSRTGSHEPSNSTIDERVAFDSRRDFSSESGEPISPTSSSDGVFKLKMMDPAKAVKETWRELQAELRMQSSNKRCCVQRSYEW